MADWLVALIVGIGLTGAVGSFGIWFNSWVDKKAPEPLPKIDRLDELVDLYIMEHSDGKLPQKRILHHEQRMEWQLEFNELLNHIEFQRFLKDYRGLKPEADAKALGYHVKDMEGDLLKAINAYTNRYGFYHPKTQAIVKFREERLVKHLDQLERWKKNG